MVVTALVAPGVAGAATSPRISGASRHHVLQNDSSTLTGTAPGETTTVYRKVGGDHYHRLATVKVARGRWSLTVRPVAGKVNRYRVGSTYTDVTSTACAPLATHGSVAAWFNIRRKSPAVADHWADLICSAAPGSTITLASMFIFGGTPLLNRLINDLRAVHVYRKVHIRVITERSQYATRAEASTVFWTWSEFSKRFDFTTVTECEYGCTVPGKVGTMHMKYMTVSRTIFGEPAVMESTINWSAQQFSDQNGSAVYFYNNRKIYDAYVAESGRVEHRTRATETTETRGWRSGGAGIAYAFDPSTVDTDPIVDELTTLSCRPGDYIEIVNANITRGRFVHELDRLQAAGCTLRIITEQSFRPPKMDYTVRHMTTHDKFVLVVAHNKSGPIREVMTGSEDYRPASMELAEEQLLRIRLTKITTAYAHWFTYEWGQAVAALVPVTISTGSLADGVDSKKYSAHLRATGGAAPYVWSLISGTLPPGLKLARTGALTGKPTKAGKYAFTVKVTDSRTQTSTKAVTVKVTSLAIKTDSLPSVVQGKKYSASLAAYSPKTTLEWSIASGKLPAGLTLAHLGTISGTPTKAGKYTFTAKVTDKARSSATHKLRITVKKSD
jgi:hypothetical protein